MVDTPTPPRDPSTPTAPATINLDLTADKGTGSAKRRWLRRSMIASQVVLGLMLGLAVAEYAFFKRDDGAFPHVNFYVVDAELGVRLEPGASMRFRLHDNPLSTIKVNAQGYRGEDWPTEPGDDELLVVGDSQVFGLGVNDNETFSARLEQLTGRPVLNAGVPTYGPREYMAITKEILEQRGPSTVIYVLNFLNDPFELERPNTDRHTVWDGWAVRSETAPAEVLQFPGRHWLFSKSHLVYAARRWLHERNAAKRPELADLLADLGVPSEGNWSDLIAEGKSSLEHDEQSKAEAAEHLRERRKRIAEVDEKIDSSHRAIDELIAGGFEEWNEEQAAIARAQPGDIVIDRYSESGRSITVTAAHIRAATKARNTFIKQMRTKEGRRKNPALGGLITRSEALAKERQQLRLEIAAGDTETRYPSVFDDHLATLAGLCESHGAELIVVALPVDVQVSAQEWLKYDLDPSEAPDMEPSLALLDDLILSAEAVGARGLNATLALREAGPGAFLDGDIHMTATGHAALAGALATMLSNAPPARRPRAGLPDGRNFPPARKRWRPTDEVVVKGSTRAGCSTQILDDWLKVVCTQSNGRAAPMPSGIEVLIGETPETMTLVTADGVALMTPLLGDPFTARFDWDHGARELRITWPTGEAGQPQFHGEFVTVESSGRPPDLSPEAAQLCECQQQLTEQVDCAQVWGEVSTACFASYAGKQLDCEMLLACAQGDPLAMPVCPEGFVNATATNDCYRPCDDRNPCAAGTTCTPYNGGKLCFRNL